MNETNLGQILTQKRHERGITQSDLASHLGVSKGAVSKWETGSSLPDISLLPLLASYFDISIDELIGYRPQMEKEEIRKLYIRLSKDFAQKPFDEVLFECLETGKKYYSCYPLLFQLGNLLVNNAFQSSDPDKTTQVVEKGLEYFHRVRTETDEPNLQKDALLMEAYCLLMLKRPSEVLDLLEPVYLFGGSPEPLLSSAYRLSGNDKEAKKILQAGIYKQIVTLIDLFSSYLFLCLDDMTEFSEVCERFYQIVSTFKLKELHPGLILGVYLIIARNWLLLGESEKALDTLEEYTDLAVSDIYPLLLHGDSFFNLLDEFLDSELPLGAFPPGDEKLIRHSMTQALSENPVFLSLKGNSRFTAMVDRLRANEEEK